jgi:hypothetical protein
MSLRARRILFILFVLVFLIATPAIWLYASGYRLGSGFFLEKTGILVVDTEPDGAAIYLNGKPHQGFWSELAGGRETVTRTPAKIKNLLPGEYIVTVERPGYQTWDKKINIVSGGTSFIEEIRLLSNNLPVLESAGEYRRIKPSPDGRYLAGIASTSFRLYDIREGIESIYNTASNTVNQSSDKIKWSASSNQVIIADRWLLFVDNWLEPFDLAKIINPQSGNPGFDPFQDGVIYYRTAQTLHAYDLEQKKGSQLPVSAEFKDYLVKNRIVYTLEKNESSVVINKHSINAGRTETIANLPLASYAFVYPDKPYLNICDQDHNLFYIVDPDSALNPIRDSITNVKRLEWVSNSELFFAGQYEISRLDMAGSRRELLTRISEPIREIMAHPEGRHLIYTTDRAVYALELAWPGKNEAIKLLELPVIKSPSLHNNGNDLFFISEFGNQRGIYRLHI